MKKSPIQSKRFKPKFRVKKDDMVEVIAGEDKGKKARIIEVDYTAAKVLLEGINIVSKHTKPNAQYPQGGIIKKEAPIHLSNVMLVNPATGKGARVGIKTENGKKERVFKEHPKKNK
ncbi:MAG: 50S ribosomal protein L24 [Chitinophagales bacterium]